MKLAEALQERADLNRQLEQMKMRLYNNATVQEGEQPAEPPEELLEELERKLSRLEELMAHINLTNSRTMVEGKTLTEQIARRDCMTLRLRFYRDFLNEAGQTAQRASRTEIKIFSTVNVRQMQKQVDGLSAQLRGLDNLIQQTNWTTDLLD